MPVSPKPRCRKCGALHCTDPSHAKQPRPRTQPSMQRPERNTWPERRRRAAVVSEWLAVHGRELEDGSMIARCPDCREWRTRWVADHVVPLVMGGSEDGALRVHCSVCSGRQGARLAAWRKRKRI